MKKDKFYWSDEYLSYIELNFDSIFQEMYEETFVDKIFLSHEARVYEADFITAIAGDIDDAPKLEWIFNPTLIREEFQKKVQLPGDLISESSFQQN